MSLLTSVCNDEKVSASRKVLNINAQCCFKLSGYKNKLISCWLLFRGHPNVSEVEDHRWTNLVN